MGDFLVVAASAHAVRWHLAFRSLVALVLAFLLSSTGTNYAEVSAPAFVVMLFEALFQTSGEPEESMRRLVVGGAIITAMALVAAIVGADAWALSWPSFL